MREDYSCFDSDREDLIKKSRDVLKLSKQIIYAVHRDDLQEALTLVDNIKNKVLELQDLASKNVRLENVGMYRMVLGEYVEALLYFYYVSDDKMMTHTELGVDTEAYLTGLVI